jgi:hypothetical protein
MQRVREPIEDDDGSELYEAWKAACGSAAVELEMLLEYSRRGNLLAARELLKEAAARLRQIAYRDSPDLDFGLDLTAPLAEWLAVLLVRLAKEPRIVAQLLMPRPKGGKRPTQSDALTTFRWSLYRRVRDGMSHGQTRQEAIYAVWQQKHPHPITKRPPTQKTIEKWYQAELKKDRHRLRDFTMGIGF